MRKVHKSLKNKNRKVSSNNWIHRHINDQYVQQSKIDGYRSRAAYKLLEINKKFNIFKNGLVILDLGAAPGSWSQVVKKLAPYSKVLSIDLLNIEPISGVTTLQKNLYDDDFNQIINQFSNKYDVIMSDIAPNTTGIKSLDHLKIIDICETIFEIAIKNLNEKGILICKFFQGGLQAELLQKFKMHFKKVSHFKPNASRVESKEIYIIAQK
ncbi:MAG: RlmE family RNA methyltransferase [Rickettsiales bacterium]